MPEQKTRWQLLFEQLKSRDWTQPAIRTWLAEREPPILVGQATLSDLARGVTLNPNFDLGNALTELLNSQQVPPTAAARG